MAAENERVPSSVARGRRIDEIRASEAQVTRDGGAVVLHDDYESADMDVTEVAASWGPTRKVQAYDKMAVMLDHTAGTTTTSVEIRAQVSEYDAKTEDSLWHDYYVRNEAGSLSRWKTTLTTNADLDVVFDMPVVGKYMRFKIWVTGATPTGSRALLKGIRDKNGV